MKPRLLDLFCKAGGAAVGYYRAGFEVVGVDIEPQPNYPFPFYQADALEFCAAHGHEFDFLHASPVCKGHTRLQSLGAARNGSYPDHPDLVGPTREQFQRLGKPYIIENVPGAPLIKPFMLCGTMFGLKVYRHRLFESNLPILRIVRPAHEPHRDKTPSAGNGLSPKGFISVCGTGGVRGLTAAQIMDVWSNAMGIDWMTREELSQAVPPAYTEWIGAKVIAHITATRETA